MKIKEVLTSEYKSVFIAEDGTAWANGWVTGIGAKLVQYQGNHKFLTGSSGQYNTLLLKPDGDVYVNNPNNTILTFLQYDVSNIAFKAMAVECKMQTYMAIRSDGSIWSMGYNSYMWFGTTKTQVLGKWTKIPGQPNVKFKQIAKGVQLVALAEDGSVYTLADGTTSWVKKTLPGPVEKIFAGYRGSYIALIHGTPYGWGQTRYLTGINGTITNYESLESAWGLNGRLVRDIAINDNTTHFVTDDNKLYGFGDNAQGEVGVGWELVNRKEIYKGSWYIWNWIDATQSNYQTMAFVQKPTLLGSTIVRVFGGGTFAYYKYAQDTDGTLYSWGRNKAVVLANGMAISNESAYPNALDVLTPTPVDPFSYVIKMPQLFVPGTVSAGADQTTDTGESTLTGIATPSGSATFSYEIVKYEWTKLPGPVCTISNNTSPSLRVTNMQDGIYVFELKVTDENGATMTDTVTVTAKMQSIPPTVVTGENQILIGNWTDLSGMATPSVGISYLWEKFSGPSGDTLVDADKPTAIVSFTTAGTYVYRLTARNSQGATGIRLIEIIVAALENKREIIVRRDKP